MTRILLALLFLTSTAHAQITLPHNTWVMASPPSSERVVLSHLVPDLANDTSLRYGRDWAVFIFNGVSYERPDIDYTFAVGQAFWIIHSTGETLELEYPGTPLSGTVDILLSDDVSRWNMVGVPSTEPSLPVYLSLATSLSPVCRLSTCSFFQSRVYQFVLGQVWAYEDGQYVNVSDKPRKPGTGAWIYGNDPGFVERHTGN